MWFVERIFKPIFNGIKSVGKVVVDFVADAGEAIENAPAVIPESVKKAAEDAEALAIRSLGKVETKANEIKTDVKMGITTLKNGVDTLVTNVAGKVDDAVNAGRAALQGVWTAVEELWEAGQTLAGEGLAQVRDTGRDLLVSAETAANTALDAAKKRLEALEQAVRVETRGTDDDDLLEGFGFASYVYGLDGNDTISNSAGYGELYGGAGDDKIDGIGLSVDIDGGAGNDTLFGGAGVTKIRGGTGNDKMEAIGAVNALFGDDGRDRMEATGGDNKMFGGTGDDVMTARGGRSVIRGEDGDDDIKTLGAWNDADGGLGDDFMRGLGIYNDLAGGAGDDTILGLGGENALKGGAGNDEIKAAGIGASAWGGSGDDEIIATGGINRLFGEDGNDTIIGSGGVNIIHGGAGNDRLVANGGINEMQGGSGDDLLLAYGLANFQYGGMGNDTIGAYGQANIQFGQAGDDVMVTGAGVGLNFQDGGAGEDWLFAVGKANIQLGGADADVLIAVGGVNIQHGGAGDDVLGALGGANVQVGADGDDWLISLGLKGTAQFGDHLWSALPQGINIGDTRFDEEVAKLNDKVDYEGQGNNVMIAGGQGNLQFGGDGDDIAFGGGTLGNLQFMGGGDDLAVGFGKGLIQYGDAGNDILVGLGVLGAQFAGDGDDVIIGVARGKKAGAQIQHGGDGDDLLIGFGLKEGRNPLEKFKTKLENAQKLQQIVDAARTGEGDKSPGELTKDFGQEKLQKVLLRAVPSVNVQLAGDGNDTFISGGELGVQAGGAGTDIFLGGGAYNLSLGGDGNDLMLTDTSSLNVYHGGDDDDWILDTGVFVSMAAYSTLDVQELKDFIAQIRTILEPVEAVIDAIDKVEEVLAFFDPLQVLEKGFAPTRDKLESLFDIDTNQFIGSWGDDILAAGSSGGDLVGGPGNDTYVFTFGYQGEHDIDEAGLDAAREWADILGIDAVPEISQADAGGRDILEMRGFGGIIDITPENLRFTSTHEGDLIIGLRTAGGTELEKAGYIRIKNMDDAATQVEVLRVVTADGVIEFDLAAAWDDGLFEESGWGDDFAAGLEQIINGDWPSAWEEEGVVDLSPYFLDDGPGRGVQDDFDATVGVWVEQVKTALERIPGAAGVLEDATETVVDITELAGGLPGVPDIV